MSSEASNIPSEASNIPSEASNIPSEASKIPSDCLEYFPLKMVADKKTEMYVKFARVMVILQGPYTKGRSEVQKDVERKFKSSSCVVSDDMYAKKNRTVCKAESTEEYHSYFRDEARLALEEGNNLLVVDSTVSNHLQNNFYISLAYQMQYAVHIMPPLISGEERDYWPTKSQAHSFRELDPRHKTMKSANQFQHLFCAWYLHDVDSSLLRNTAQLFMQDCIEDIHEFKDMFSKVKIPGEKIDMNMSTEMFTSKIANNYFNFDDKWQDSAYCVTKMFDNKLFGMIDYFKKPEVMQNYGKMSKLTISGFIVSPHMVAARVKLPFKFKELWDMRDEMDENFKEDPICPSDLVASAKKDLPEVKVKRICTKSNPTMVYSYTVDDPTQNIGMFNRGRACHIVLGKGPKESSRNVDFGVQYALRRQNRAQNENIEAIQLDRCVVRRYGKYWFIDLKQMLTIDGFFTSCVKAFPYDNVV